MWISKAKINDFREDVIKSKPWSFFRRLSYIALGVPVGWSIAHYFVIEYGGNWPEVSVFRYVIHLISEFGGLAAIAGAGAAAYRAFIYKKKQKNE